MEANWSNGEQCWKVAATSRRSNVATSPRRDVPTSLGTSRRPHIVTFQRRDVGLTDTEVNNQKRRDVSTSRRQHGICTSSFKAPMVEN